MIFQIIYLYDLKFIKLKGAYYIQIHIHPNFFLRKSSTRIIRRCALYFRFHSQNSY